MTFKIMGLEWRVNGGSTMSKPYIHRIIDELESYLGEYVDEISDF